MANCEILLRQYSINLLEKIVLHTSYLLYQVIHLSDFIFPNELSGRVLLNFFQKFWVQDIVFQSTVSVREASFIAVVTKVCYLFAVVRGVHSQCQPMICQASTRSIRLLVPYPPPVQYMMVLRACMSQSSIAYSSCDPFYH